MTTFNDRVYELGGIPVGGSGNEDYYTTGNVYFVHYSDGSDSNNGTPKHPFKTLDYAIGKCTANDKDIIFLMPGHSEAISASVAVDIAGISIIGLGNGRNRATLTPGITKALNISAANVAVKNIRFATPSASCATIVYVDAADAVIEGCLFECGANFLDGIEITADGDNCIIKNNEFRITANGPDSAITFSGAADGTQIIGNYFMGGSDTNAWDVAAVDAATAGSQVVITNTRIEKNRFIYGVGVDIESAGTTGIIADNYFAEGTLGSMLDPGALMCFENYEADAPDEHGRAFPTTGAS